jgi:Spy/CpxP family protein refolding chaperone
MGTLTTLSTGVAFLSALALQPAWAEPDNPHGKGDYDKGEYSHGKGDGEYGRGSGKDGHGYGGGQGMGMGMMGGWHASTGHLLRHMLKHSTEIGLKDDQVTKLKDMQLNLDKTRIKAEADIMISERELRAMVEDEKTDLSAIESKLKAGESQEVALRMAAIKTRRDALALLTPDQRGKLKSEHEKMMPPHRVDDGGSPHGDSTGGMKKDDGQRAR